MAAIFEKSRFRTKIAFLNQNFKKIAVFSLAEFYLNFWLKFAFFHGKYNSYKNFDFGQK